jgi:hypothetical protein
VSAVSLSIHTHPLDKVWRSIVRYIGAGRRWFLYESGRGCRSSFSPPCGAHRGHFRDCAALKLRPALFSTVRLSVVRSSSPVRGIIPVTRFHLRQQTLRRLSVSAHRRGVNSSLRCVNAIFRSSCGTYNPGTPPKEHAGDGEVGRPQVHESNESGNEQQANGNGACTTPK